MNKSLHHKGSQRSKSVVATLTASLLTFGALLHVPTVASATDLSDAFTNWSDRNNGAPAVEILTDSDDDDITLWEYVEVKAQWDLTGFDVSAGDTFTLELPAEFNADINTFKLDTTDGIVVGECTVANRTDSTNALVSCTLTDQEFLETHTEISGWLSLYMQATQTTSNTSVNFTTPTDVISVELPGTEGITDPSVYPIPEEISKEGWINSARTQAHWRIYVPGDHVIGDQLVVVDPLSEGLELTRRAVKQVPNTMDGWAHYILTGGDLLPENHYTFDQEENVVTFTVPEVDHHSLYIFEIDTSIQDPAQVTEETSFSNTATVNDQEVSHTTTLRRNGDGTVIGFVNGFQITKHVEGDAAEQVSGLEFTVNYSYLTPGSSTAIDGDPLVIAAGESQGFAPLPSGTTVTLKEIDLPEVAGVEWATPPFEGDGVTDHGDGTATLNITLSEMIDVVLLNEATIVPESAEPTEPTDTPESTNSQTPTSVPTETESTSTKPAMTPTESQDAHTPAPEQPSATSGSGDGELATTGSNLQGITVGVAVLMLILGMSAVWFAQRSATHK